MRNAVGRVLTTRFCTILTAQLLPSLVLLCSIARGCHVQEDLSALFHKFDTVELPWECRDRKEMKGDARYRQRCVNKMDSTLVL